jgi:hypothetical protein
VAPLFAVIVHCEAQGPDHADQSLRNATFGSSLAAALAGR